jgi:PAS domain S-box-containing protein
LTAIGSGVTQISRPYLDRILLENADDVIHVLSLKGLFLYLSPSGRRLLEYDTNELVGNALSSVCHPSDIVPVTRELKQSVPGASISVAYRIRRKYSGYMWFECLGSLHVDPGKGRKCLILVGRERPVYALGKAAVLGAGGIGESDLWSKMSISGMFLFVSSNVRALLDRQPAELFGRNIHEFMRDESRGELGKALDITRTGRQATFKHELRHKRGHVLQAQTRLYPGDSKPGSKPSFLIAQTRLLKSLRSNFLPSRTPTVLSPEGDFSPGFATSATIGSSSTLEHPRDASSTLSSRSLDSSTEAGLGSQEDTILPEDNIFEELKCTRSSNWQFELRQIERRNRLLAEELQGLLSRRKKRKRKKGPFEKACVSCNTRITPEWRRGPSGNRDLCNSCGLRWAKQVGSLLKFGIAKSIFDSNFLQTGRISPRKNSDYSDKNSAPSSAKPSPGSMTDDKTQESNKTTLHISDNVSYSNRLRE